MLEMKISPKNVAAIASSIKKIKEMVKSGAIEHKTPVHIVMEPGIYAEQVTYNLSNPLVLESVNGASARDVVIQVQNCEKFHKGPETRAAFILGDNVTNVTLRNFTILNTHVKSIIEGSTLEDSAEALSYCGTRGALFAEKMNFEGHQNVVYTQGYSSFKECSFKGDVDVIWGNPILAYFEECFVHVAEDNRGDFNGYGVKSLAVANKPGFVFNNCRFTCDRRKKSECYVMRTEGKGSAYSKENWDSIALINCMVSEYFNEEFGWDDDHMLEVHPRANAKCGWREYNTKIVKANGTVEESDTCMRNVKSYLLTDNDYTEGYASRYLILKNTPLSNE